VQKFASSQGIPLLPGTAVHDQLNSLHVPIMHGFSGGAHGFGSPEHAAATHLSLMVQNRPSSQGCPSLTGSETQLPAWHSPTEHGSNLPSSHTPPSFCGSETQLPAWHFPYEQPVKSPLSQAEFSLVGCALQPTAGSQTPTEQAVVKTWHEMGWPLPHTPPEHRPAPVQRSPSSHCAPSLPAMFLQVWSSSSQTPRWQLSCDPQNLGVPPAHAPAMHVSSSVQ
jgi:hypothetical protein